MAVPFKRMEWTGPWQSVGEILSVTRLGFVHGCDGPAGRRFQLPVTRMVAWADRQRGPHSGPFG
jgi:hypothetical protein